VTYMEVKIDYDVELVYAEKKKILWFMDEFEEQFQHNPQGKITKNMKKAANIFINYMIDGIDVTNPDVLEFFKQQIQKLEETYPYLF
jgi:hypothetical protein